MNHVEILNNSEDPFPNKKCRRFIKKVLSLLKVNRWEVSLSLVDEKQIAQLNEEYRGKEGSTDVLTFNDPAALQNPVLNRIYPGDTILCLPVIKRNAQEHHIPPTEELKRVLIHSLLHLMGEEHKSYDFTQDPMLIKQEALLKRVSKKGEKEWLF